MANQKTLADSSRDVKTITVPREEYDRLQAVASRFDMMRNLFELDFFASPPTRDSNTIMQGLEKTGKYNKAFLKSIQRGLKNSLNFYA